MTKLETLFLDAICNETPLPGQIVECNCGTGYQHRPDLSPQQDLRIGTFAGATLVKSCGCPFASSFGNMLWQHRHQVAAFLRGMSDALEADRQALITVLPPAPENEIRPA